MSSRDDCCFLSHCVMRLLFFFFYSSCAPRDLPSFPTRRSSDLDQNRQDPPRHVVGGHQWRPVARSAGGRRSEEHTSELQSRGHLVCRLLLEKKKKKIKEKTKKENKQQYEMNKIRTAPRNWIESK